MELYKYQEQTVEALLKGKHFCIAGVGTGKSATSLTWAKRTGKPKTLVVTTASVRDSGQYYDEAAMWCGEKWTSQSSLSVISWAKLAEWVREHWTELGDYAFIFDEVASAKAGVSSQRGKAFLKIANQTDSWAGFTATPGDRWIDFYAYFTACHKVHNKTEFQRRFCFMQTYRGFPEITGYHDEETLHEWWKELSYSPDTSQVLAELPPQSHQVVKFNALPEYKKCEKNHTDLDDELLDNASATRHYLRQLCATQPAKLKWVKEFVENLGTNCVIFYSYTAEGDALEKVCMEALGIKVGANTSKTKRGSQNASERSTGQPKVWRIDGQRHDIPNKDTVGPKDVILVQWQAGSMGLNFQFAHYWVANSPCDAYWQFNQGRGRINRIGQKNHMHFYYLRSTNTVEDGIYKALHEKREFSVREWYAGREKK